MQDQLNKSLKPRKIMVLFIKDFNSNQTEVIIEVHKGTKYSTKP